MVIVLVALVAVVVSPADVALRPGPRLPGNAAAGGPGVQTTPDSNFELPAGKVIEAPKSSLSVKSFRISAPAALKVLWPELYSGKGGVGNVEA